MTEQPTVYRRPKAKALKSRSISFRLAPGVVKDLNAIARKNDVSRNNLVALILYDYLRRAGPKTVENLIREDRASEQPSNFFE